MTEMSERPEIHPLTPDRLGDFVTLFGPSGACYGCWCQYFRLSPAEHRASDPASRRALMEDRIRRGPPPGLILYLGDQPTGWMQIGPRADVPQWNNPRRATTPLPDAPADDPGVWAISCFFVRGKARGQGLAHALVVAGIGFARAGGARLIEAAPIDRAKHSKSVGLFVGATTVFARAGFAEVARQKPGRPLMRLVVQPE